MVPIKTTVNYFRIYPTGPKRNVLSQIGINRDTNNVGYSLIQLQQTIMKICFLAF